MAMAIIDVKKQGINAAVKTLKLPQRFRIVHVQAGKPHAAVDKNADDRIRPKKVCQRSFRVGMRRLMIKET